MSITGEPGRGPMRAGIPIADLSAGLFAALGTFVALLERETSGEGQWVRSSLLEAMIFMLDFQGARWLVGEEVPEQVGNNHPTGAPMGRFETRDGYINIGMTPPMWPKLWRSAGARRYRRRSRLRDPAGAAEEPGQDQRAGRGKDDPGGQRKLDRQSQRGGHSLRAESMRWTRFSPTNR